MKTRISTILAALLISIVLCIPALAVDGSMDYVIDTNGLLTYEEWETLENQAADISQRFGCGVYIVTLDDYTLYGSGGVYDVTTQIYNDEDSGFGIGAERNGIILLVSMAERDWAMFVHGSAAEYAFNSYGQAQLEERFLPALSENDWYGSFSAYLAACGEYLSLAEAGEPVSESPVKGVLIAVVISCAVALFVCLILKGKMNSVRRKAEAQTYIVGGLQLMDSYDRYTHTTRVSRTIEKRSSSNSGGGGSGRSGKF